jgi:hypothetical protein
MPWAIPLALIAGSTYMKYQAQKESTKRNVALAEYNAKVDRQKATQIERADVVNRETRRKKLLALMSRNTTLHAKASIITTTGTALRVGIEQTGQATYNSIMETYNSKIRAGQHRSSAEAYDFKAKSIKRQGKYALGAILFSGAAQMYGYASAGGTPTGGEGTPASVNPPGGFQSSPPMGVGISPPR